MDMMLGLATTTMPPPAATFARERHVLLVMHDQQARYRLADVLLDAEFRLTLASSVDAADLLLDPAAGYDLLVADDALPGHGGGLARLARASCPGLPILLIETGGAGGNGVLEAAVRAMERWPVTPGYRMYTRTSRGIASASGRASRRTRAAGTPCASITRATAAASVPTARLGVAPLISTTSNTTVGFRARAAATALATAAWKPPASAICSVSRAGGPGGGGRGAGGAGGRAKVGRLPASASKVVWSIRVQPARAQPGITANASSRRRVKSGIPAPRGPGCA